MGRTKDRTLGGELYVADDEDLAADFARAQDLVARYNATAHAEQDARDAILAQLLGSVGAGAVVTRDLPAGVVAAGAPARVLREIAGHDRIDVPDR